MRRGALYSKTQELGCNKLALGHHFNDVIETTLLNVLYAGIIKLCFPKLKATNFGRIGTNLVLFIMLRNVIFKIYSK